MTSCAPRLRSLAPVLVPLLTGFCLVADSSAQDCRVYVANSSNNRILRTTFTPPGTTPVNTDANLHTSLRDLTLRDDGVDGIHLIACDSLGGSVLFYRDSFGEAETICAGPPERPNGASVDAAGNLFLVSSGTGAADSKEAQVWVFLRDDGDPIPAGLAALPGGYREPLGLIDDDVQADGQDVQLLEDSVVVGNSSGLLSAGDLLVLARSPGALLRYRAADVAAFLAALEAQGPADPAPAELAPDVLLSFPEGAEPTGLAFAPGGNLLIGVTSGEIRTYGTDGVRGVDFATGLGAGKFKLEVCPQGGVFQVFVADRNGGDLLRFAIAGDGTGVPNGVVTEGVEFPVGVVATTSTNVPTPSGSQVGVAPSAVIESTFEEVIFPGLTNARVFLFEDVRNQEVPTAPGLPAHRPLNLQELGASFPDIEIPAYVRPFRLGDPVSGPPTFILVEMETSAQSTGLIEHYATEQVVLGWEPDCDDPDSTMRQRIFWAPDPDDPPILEGASFIDISISCGTNRGWTRDMSYFLPGCRDTRDPAVIAAAKLAALRETYARSSSCIQPKTRKKLERLLDSAARGLDKDRIGNVIADLQSFAQTIEQSPGAFSGCADNLDAELRARAATTMFSLTELP